MAEFQQKVVVSVSGAKAGGESLFGYKWLSQSIMSNCSIIIFLKAF